MRAAWIIVGLLLGACTSHNAPDSHTVQIEARDGVPRLMIDGKPARPRIFWGKPGVGPIAIGPAAKLITFEFSPEVSEPGSGTMHLRFGAIPGEVDVDDVEVLDLTTGAPLISRCDFENGQSGFESAWSIWPPPDRNTVGGVSFRGGSGRGGSTSLHVSLSAPPQGGKWPDFHIYHNPNLALAAGHRYRVSLWVRSDRERDLSLAFYHYGPVFHVLGGPPGPFESQVGMAAAAGVRIISFPLHMPWPAPGESIDWSRTDVQCRRVLEAHPDALLLPRIDMNPPPWWRAAHPDDTMVWDTMPQPRPNAVVASPTYRREACAALATLVDHLEKHYGPHMAGYHPCGQNTEEWFYQDSQHGTLSGYAPADLKAWREWLVARYPDDKALREAWRQPDAVRSGAMIPAPASRRASPAGALRDPASERMLIDFAQFQQDAMADCVLELARTVRQATRGRRLVVFFYGYTFEHAAVPNGPAASGHYRLRKLLDSPDIDVLCAPISYFDRGVGQSGPAMVPAESVALAGKLWLNEDDARTHLARGPQEALRFGADTLEKSRNILLRNTGQCALRNFGTWWMDLVSGGWFDEPALWREMDNLRELDRHMLDRPSRYEPQIAVVVDEASMLRVAPRGVPNVTMPGVYEARRPLGRIGAPYGQYLLDDVLAGKVRAKLFVMLATWRLTPEQRERLREATRGATVLWCYAPGYDNGDALDLQGITKTTGFNIKELTVSSARATPSHAGNALGITLAWGLDRAVSPLFSCDGVTPDETLANYADGSPAVVMRKIGQGVSIFAGTPGLTSELLRAAAGVAGVHLYTRSDCNVIANGPYILVHGASDGPIVLSTNSRGEVIDAISGERLGHGPTITLPLGMGQTRLLRLVDQR